MGEFAFFQFLVSRYRGGAQSPWRLLAGCPSTTNIDRMKTYFRAMIVWVLLLSIPHIVWAETSNSPFTIKSDGWVLHADLVQPDNAVAIAVLLHKVSGDRRAYAPLAQLLATAGIASVRIDLRGHGESINLGEFDPQLSRYLDPDDPDIVRNFELVRAGDRDIVSLFHWLKGQSSLNGLPLVMVGSSYTGQEMVEVMDTFGAADVYVALAPGSFTQDSIAKIDPSNADWLFVRAEDELPFFPALFEAIDAGSDAEIWTLPGSGHATDLFETHDDLEIRLKNWIIDALAGHKESGQS
jgi:pimeloyl-ACP methyl ester carboxylesterase